MQRTLFYPIYLISLSLLSFFRCGTNTDTPVAPFIFIIPPAVPQILSVVSVNSNITDSFESNAFGWVADPAPEFILRYYVTNREPQFVGYNLYITTATPAIIQTITGEYLEDGVQPSFPHLPFENSTDSSKVVTKRIRFHVPPPGAYHFQKCQIYNFTMRSFLTGGLISNPSASVSACAKNGDLAFQYCTEGSGCNSTTCAVAGCANPSACPVGTKCNPCLFADRELLGCTCPNGSKPPGCQFVGP
ncbi:LIC11073 family putative lipoprotein [Leptospira idonii]|uniref:Lipoprotein n=1 Tax=Leptospira idonii TaxID=1193500 RepID=A0A4R9M209_9LEPT|nr:hypothetical protein [Leptospira idonii]TGN20132.1 hypothetical protein EHS15_05405 [Leptospira idonii]